MEFFFPQKWAVISWLKLKKGGEKSSSYQTYKSLEVDPPFAPRKEEKPIKPHEKIHQKSTKPGARPAHWHGLPEVVRLVEEEEQKHTSKQKSQVTMFNVKLFLPQFFGKS